MSRVRNVFNVPLQEGIRPEYVMYSMFPCRRVYVQSTLCIQCSLAGGYTSRVRNVFNVPLQEGIRPEYVIYSMFPCRRVYVQSTLCIQCSLAGGYTSRIRRHGANHGEESNHRRQRTLLPTAHALAQNRVRYRSCTYNGKNKRATESVENLLNGLGFFLKSNANLISWELWFDKNLVLVFLIFF